MIRRKISTRQTTSDKLAELDDELEGESAFPGPSPNSATNLLIADVVFRGAAMLFRRAAEEHLLRARVSPAAARRALSGKTMGRSIATYAATRMATRSIPGLLLVGGGLVAKTLFDRRMAKRKAEEVAAAAQPSEDAED